MATPTYLTTFVHEVEDLLEKIEAAILALESTPGDHELIHQLFRAFHTLKGSAAVAGVMPISAFTHHVETAMDKLRSGVIALSPPLVSAVLAAKDHVAALLAEALGQASCDPAVGAELIARMAALTAGESAAAGTGGLATSPVVVPEAAGASEESAGDVVDYLVSFTASVDPASLGVDPATILEDLRQLGKVAVLGELPAWQLLVSTGRGRDAIHDAFIFVEPHGVLSIDQGLSLFADEPVVDATAGEPALADAPVATPAASPAREAITAPGPAREATRSRQRVAAEATVRVSSQRLDQLAKLIGELVITQSRLEQVHSQHPIAEMAGTVEAMERLIGDLRDGVLGLRMVPIGTLFTRFHRLVRDLCGELAKDVELVTSGDDTELDKTVIDQLGDALVHILRNSMDHGIESPDARVAAGKPARGTLSLAASHEGAAVIITITDDGRGIDTAAVRRKAEAQGLVAPGEQLSEQDTIALIMRPGFSTAAAVTQLSGRGVGMDVVKKTVESLRGSIAIKSRPGGGTEIRLKLPLTLAIIDGLLVEIHGDRFIVPMAAVTENLELGEAERRANNGRNVVALRGELVPYIRLRELFQLTCAAEPLEKIVVVWVDGQRVGLVVDRVIGSHQTVIQPLGPFYRDVDLFSGTTILGDGRVAMILDLPGAVRQFDRAQPTFRSPS